MYDKLDAQYQKYDLGHEVGGPEPIGSASKETQTVEPEAVVDMEALHAKLLDCPHPTRTELRCDVCFPYGLSVNMADQETGEEVEAYSTFEEYFRKTYTKPDMVPKKRATMLKSQEAPDEE